MSESVVNTQGDPWSLLDAELDAWVLAGKQASLWWRDDDAMAPGQALDQLIDLTRHTGLLLAVIPAGAEQALASRLAHCSHVQVAQHGYSHTNHAPRGQGLGAWELGLHRGEAQVLADLALGRNRLETLFGSMFIPVIVPPWNRIAPELLLPVAQQGYWGVSAFGPRGSAEDTPGLIIANAHCDPIRWKSGAAFAGEHKSIAQLVSHLEARRCGEVAPCEHTGFLTHHLDLDNAGWAFCTRLAKLIDQHPGAQWVPPSTVFGKPS